MTKQNPLLANWNTPFEVPSFDKITNDHYRDAFDTALAESEAEIERIANNSSEPTFVNTIAAMESAGEALSKVSGVFFNLSGSHTNDEMQTIQREMAPKLSAHHSKIMLNAILFARVEVLYLGRDELDLNPEAKRVLERYHSNFVRSGSKLEGDERTPMAEVSSELATLGTQFSQNILADESAYELILEAGDDLVGLPDFLIAAAASAAKERGHDGKYVITLSRSLIEPFLQFASRRDLRETAYNAWIARGENGGETDNRDIIAKTLNLREERANLLGFKTFADFKLDDQMAKTPDAVRDLLMKVWEPAKKRAGQEAEKLQELANSQGANFKIAPWDWRYYSEKVRSAEHDLDEAEIKPYLQLDKIIDAAFDTAHRLFDLSFEERNDIPTYHPDVRTFEVKNQEGQHVALFIGDFLLELQSAQVHG